MIAEWREPSGESLARRKNRKTLDNVLYKRICLTACPTGPRLDLARRATFAERKATIAEPLGSRRTTTIHHSARAAPLTMIAEWREPSGESLLARQRIGFVLKSRLARSRPMHQTQQFSTICQLNNIRLQADLTCSNAVGHSLSQTTMFLNTFSNRSVLVTGHTGFKGSWLCQWLLRLGAEVHGYALSPQPHEKLFNQLDLHRQLASDTRADIRDLDSLVRTLDATRPILFCILRRNHLLGSLSISPSTLSQRMLWGQ